MSGIIDAAASGRVQALYVMGIVQAKHFPSSDKARYRYGARTGF